MNEIDAKTVMIMAMAMIAMVVTVWAMLKIFFAMNDDLSQVYNEPDNEMDKDRL